MSGRNGYRLYSAADAQPTDAFRFFPMIPAGETAVLNRGGDLDGVGGYFDFEGMHAELLLSMMPPVVYIRAEANKAALRWSTERLLRELRDPQPGGALIAEHLAQALLIEALRMHLVENSHHSLGWLFALADKQIRPVIAAMHSEPGRSMDTGGAGAGRGYVAVEFRRSLQKYW